MRRRGCRWRRKGVRNDQGIGVGGGRRRRKVWGEWEGEGRWKTEEEVRRRRGIEGKGEEEALLGRMGRSWGRGGVGREVGR